MSAGERSLLEVGRVVKPHGIRGELAVTLTSNRTERMTPGANFSTRLGPLVIERVRPFQQGYVVKCEGIDDRNEAERWRNVVLCAEPIEDDDEIWIHELFDAVVKTSDGITRGVVVSVEENPASDLLVLDTGFLVPLTFVTEIDPNTLIVVDAPEGLFE